MLQNLEAPNHLHLLQHHLKHQSLTHGHLVPPGLYLQLEHIYCLQSVAVVVQAEQVTKQMVVAQVVLELQLFH
jgi:hypothetical protein